MTEEEEFEAVTNAKVPNAKVQISIIMQLADLHDSLVDLVNQINSCFSIQVRVHVN